VGKDENGQMDVWHKGKRYQFQVELRRRLGLDDIILMVGTTAKQVAMIWACAAKRS